MFDNIVRVVGGVTFRLPPDPSVVYTFRDKSEELTRVFEEFYAEFGQYATMEE